MALLKVYEYPHPCLSIEAKAVDHITQEIQTIACDMLETMYKSNGCGLAATQVNSNHRMFVMDTSEEGNHPQIFINPKITPLTDELEQTTEGCLSVPNVYETVKRPARIRIEALNEKGESFSLDLEGLASVCAQHELDHLNGKVFLDRLSRLKRTRALKKLGKSKQIAKM